MKKLIFLAVFLVSANSSFAEEPVVSVICENAGTEFGNQVVFQLSKNFRYGQLAIKRVNASADYTRDLSSFNGGRYRLDLAAKGGITGYSLQYATKEVSELSTTEGAISCSSSLPTELPTSQLSPPVPQEAPTQAPPKPYDGTIIEGDPIPQENRPPDFLEKKGD